ncbi:ketopantoate reductase family protein [Falsiroseomonas selenitidurans]|uniref:2-dehydropantoate 2-reductase n=1 Tax=Falsiroseomonas selenitidurans TaxID=2716335 RepID=A0ABX1E925_9PROT|nr:2-dehydropantoate 2-reductase [Falsiroseomonas selenitidurans]NKC33536.1 2-dehydropantoate 2-reductase [Falsiroseomonas selenitidurans]
MGKRIAIIGAGAVGGYAGAHMVQAGEDVTFVDFWPENVEAIRNTGLRITHLKDVPEFTVKARALHVTEVQGLSREQPFDIVFLCVKSYDTAWATMLAQPFLAPTGFVVSLQNCMNEETIAGLIGWGRTLGCIASSITVELAAPGHVKRASGKGGAAHTVYRVGEVHGRVTDRAQEVARLTALSDSTLVTGNLWGERWSKLVANVMGNGMSAVTGLVSREVLLDDRLRDFSARLGSEAIRLGQALGYGLEEILHFDPEIIARAGEGDPEARAAYDRQRIAEATKPGGAAHRASMGQDVMKGRRTEIDYLNGFIVRQAAPLGLPTPANAALTALVQQVERGEIQPDPGHIHALRLN